MTPAADQSLYIRSSPHVSPIYTPKLHDEMLITFYSEPYPSPLCSLFRLPLYKFISAVKLPIKFLQHILFATHD